MSDKRKLLTIVFHNDDETGMNYVGEVDGAFPEDVLGVFIKRFGDKGCSDLINHLAFLIYQVKNRQMIDAATNNERCDAKSA